MKIGKAVNELQKSELKQTASGRLKPLLPSHRIVYRALRAANLTFERVINANELIELLTQSEKDELITSHRSPLPNRVRKILTMLAARGIIFEAGRAAGELYFGATEIINAETAQMPKRKSRRERVLEVVREAVTEIKRAVRTEEAWDYATRLERLNAFTPKMFTHDVLSLLQTGELKRARTGRGDTKGVNLYLPAEFNVSLYLPTEPLTWLEEVSQAFDLVWQEHLAEAKTENRKPFAVSTGEVRKKWANTPNAHPKAFESLPVINAMLTLSKGTQYESPKFRKIKRLDERILLWCPPDFTDEMLDWGANYLSDFERIEIAVKRAIASTGRPVTVADVKDEIDLDSLLHPIGKAKIRQVLADAARDFIDEGGEQRKNKLFQRIRRVGILNNESYYYHGTSGLSEAYTYVKTLVLESDWSNLDFSPRFEQLNSSSLPGLALGNAKLLIAECGTLKERIKSLWSEKLDIHSRQRMTELLEAVSASEKKLERTTSDIVSISPPDLPNEINMAIAGLTGKDLVKVFLPLHPNFKSDTSREKSNALSWRCIRRVPNPDFKYRFSTDTLRASKFLFDRTDALTYAGSKWGGLECAFQARTAKEELGRLRDSRFVVSGLKDPDQRNRLTAIACLAFLSGDIGTSGLLTLIKQDKEAGVRQSALWAYCFRCENSVENLLNEVSQNDPNNFVRQFAERCLNRGDRGWWEL